MSWGRFDDGWHRHPKVRRCSLQARGLWATAFSWLCDNEKLNGFLPGDLVADFLPSAGGPYDLPALIEELTRVAPPFASGLWDVVEGGFWMHDYLDFNPSARQLDKQRKDTRKRVALYRSRNGVTNATVTSESRRTPGRDGTGTGSSRSSSGSQGGAGGFDRFWAAFPKKVAKQAAQKAWRTLHPDIALELRMLAALEHQRTWDAWTREHGKFIPHPATWLNGRRWEDERATVATPLFTPRGQVARDAGEEWLRLKNQPPAEPEPLRIVHDAG